MAVGSSYSSSTPELVPFVPRLFTVEEYHRLGVLGVLTEEDRVELLEGVITPKMMRNPPHDAAIMQIEETLRPGIESGWTIRIQSAMTTADSEPEPDLVVVRGRAKDYRRRHPMAEDVSLAVEVADSSLMRDRRKARIYAHAGVPVYWIVNLGDEQIEAFWQPSGADNPAYQQGALYRRGDRVPMTIAGSTLSQVTVDDLLP